MTHEIPAGWYPDPTVDGQIRYWNGSEWTDDVSTDASLDPTPAPALTPTHNAWMDEVDQTIARPLDREGDGPQILGIPDDPERGKGWLPWITAAVLIALGGVTWFVLGSGSDSDTPTSASETSDELTTSASTTTSSTTTITPTTTAIQSVAVPNVIGLDQAAATTQLQAAGLLVESVTAESTDIVPGTVMSTQPPLGADIPPGGTVTITTATAPEPECNDITGQIPPSQFTDVLSLGSPTDQLAVGWAESVGIISGVTPDTFGIDQVLSRGALATILYRYFCSPTPSKASEFSDVPPAVFYASPVAWASEMGIISGTSPTLFEPDGPTTRGQWVTVVWRSVGSPAAKVDTPFTDVGPGVFYEQALKWAYSKNLISGVDATTFDANRPLTRLDAVSLLYLLELTIDPSVD